MGGGGIYITVQLPRIHEQAGAFLECGIYIYIHLCVCPPKHLNLHGLSETIPPENLQGRTGHLGHGATSTHSRTSGCLLECGSQQHDSLPWLRVAQIEELLCTASGFP